MGISLTKDADKMICTIYREYLSRRNNGLSKSVAKDFADPQKWGQLFADWNDDDVKDTLPELKRAGLIKLYFMGGFQLEDKAIVYMENRFPNGLAQVLDWLAKVKSAIPFA